MMNVHNNDIIMHISCDGGMPMPKIVPIKDLRDTNRISEMCHESDEPIFVTRNGYGDMVIFSMEYYDKVISRLAMYDEIMKGIEQADQGKLLEGGQVLGSLKKKYGV